MSKSCFRFAFTTELMAKITNRLQELQYWSDKRRESAKKSIAKNKGKKIVFKPLSSKPAKKINPVSDNQKVRNRKYLKARKEWLNELKKVDDPVMCQGRLSEECKTCHQVGYECHHSRGKIGDLYWDKDFFIWLCVFCHRMAHDHDKEAKEAGVSVLRLTNN